MRKTSNSAPTQISPKSPHIVPKSTSSLESTTTSFRTNNNFPKKSDHSSHFQRNPNGFLPVTNRSRNSPIVSQAVANQADRVFGPRIINSSSTLSSASSSSSSSLPSASSFLSSLPSQSSLSALPSRSFSLFRSPLASGQPPVSEQLKASTLHPASAGVFSKTTTGGSVVQTSVSGSPVPQYLSDKNFFELVSCMTTIILSRKYSDVASGVQISILHAYAKGDAGINIVNFQNMAANLGRKNNPFSKLDVTKVIATKDLDTMPSQQVEKLKNLPGIRLVNVEESMVLPTINPSLENKLTLRDETKPLSAEERLSNLSGNSSPDFKLEHPVSCINGNVIEQKEVFYDLKTSVSALKEYNQVRNFSNNFEEGLVNAHKYLKDCLTLREPDLPLNQQAQVTAFNEDLEKNLENFQETGNVTELAHSYNHLLDKYGSWLVTNGIPMNLVTKIGLDNFIIDPQIRENYFKVWNHLVNSPNSPAREFCLSHFENHTKPIFDDTFTLIKPFIKYLDDNPQLKDIIFE